jgi:hypothetical protein
MRTDSNEAATVAATACEASERIEIVAERRRAHDDVFRAMVVADALRPVSIAPMRLEPTSAVSVAPVPDRGGTIRIELADGVRVTIDEGVSTAALRRVMSVLRG